MHGSKFLATFTFIDLAVAVKGKSDVVYVVCIVGWK